MMKRYLFFLLLTGIFGISNAQERVIHGKVSTLENISVANAKIMAMSTKQVVLTDTSGRFSISCNKNDKLKIFANGFYTEKVKVSENNKFVLANIRLKPGVENRESAIGYGHILDSKKLNAITTVDEDNLEFRRYNDMFELIQGQFPGVQIYGGEVVIRNTITQTSNQGALIILDGRQIDAANLQAIPPTDVKSINIIKDAGAAMYGVKGGNGVVVIETKRGKNN